jgi:hypothetical protein
MTFTLSDWVGGIEAWRFNLPLDDTRADNTLRPRYFDRTLLRAGETVHMKHFIRKHTERAWAWSCKNKAQAAPHPVVITHQGSDQNYQLPCAGPPAARRKTTGLIPADAKQGEYSVTMAGRPSGSFRVEAFRVPTMKAVLQGPKTPAVQASGWLWMRRSYLAGGACRRRRQAAHGAAGQERELCRLSRLQLQQWRREGRLVKQGTGYDDDEEQWQDEGEAAQGPARRPRARKSLTLDKAGGAHRHRPAAAAANAA